MGLGSSGGSGNRISEEDFGGRVPGRGRQRLPQGLPVGLPRRRHNQRRPARHTAAAAHINPALFFCLRRRSPTGPALGTRATGAVALFHLFNRGAISSGRNAVTPEVAPLIHSSRAGAVDGGSTVTGSDWSSQCYWAVSRAICDPPHNRIPGGGNSRKQIKPDPV